MSFSNEKEFEDAVIEKLTKLDNQWSRDILEYKTEEELIDNWAAILYGNNNQTDRLNGCPLTETEMNQIIGQINGESPFAINRRLSGKYISIIRDNPRDTLHNGKRVDLFLFDKDEIAAGKSVYQIARQPKLPVSSEVFGDRRGDLMLLINGMPLFHIELKNTPVKVEQACNQISKYMQHGVFTGFFSLVQVFVAMTPEETLYFANPGRDREFNSDYYFHWGNFNNQYINGWEEIAEKFLSIPMAHRLIGYGTIADGTDNVLKVMRSYQYHAAYKIYSQVVRHADWDDGQQKGGYVYHTTGSGKTMTSFKCAQLIKSSGKVEKIVFLMDRNELWKQTYDNYRHFSDCDDVEDTANTNSLLSKLENDTPNLLIVTSIQKMSNLTTVEPNPYAGRIAKIQQKKLVFIIDEAHRSTFGTMLRDIKLTYPKAMFFGFTGTPIMDVNAIDGITTDGLFGECLHKYTISEGIRDKNVLGFKPSKVVTFDEEDFREKVALKKIGKEHVEDLNDDEFAKYHALVSRNMADVEADVGNSLYSEGDTGLAHRLNVVHDILSKWDRISFRGKFHYILATSSIREAIEYYRLLKDNEKGLFVTAVFDPHTDNDDDDVFKDKGVEEILIDYNVHFGFHFTFGTYRRFKDDVCLRLAHKESYKDIDTRRAEAVNIVIVVNQLLTGFDSKWINTLYLDKVVEYEQFVQAVSRTNRLHGYEKQYGIIKYCRKPYTMEQNAEKALRLYAETGYEDVFVPSLGQNIICMNNDYQAVIRLFEKCGIDNFSMLPTGSDDVKLFADLFNNISNYYYCSIPQLFTWSQKTYITEDAGEVTVLLDEMTYEILHQRYSEIPRTGSSGGDMIYDIKAFLTEISSNEIDRAFMESKFSEVLKDLSNGAKPEDIKTLLDELKSNFTILSAENQITAEAILEDIYSGELQNFDENKTLAEYIEIYNRSKLKANIEKFADAFGIDRDKLSRIMTCNLKEDNLLQGGLFDQIISTLDRARAKETMEVIEGVEIKAHRVLQKAERYLKNFILSHGDIGILEGKE
ncbi:MAG: type I restriction endonuclease subunit R [Oscillospiraceae bacterium]|nr:type I restriction endonuclease subunit R [Oscillospiraceae bacterium]